MKPIQMEEIIGNDDIKTQIKIAYGAARLHNRPLPHLMLAGRSGCGKTTTAKAVADMGGSYFRELSPDSLKTAEELATVFQKLPDEGYDYQTGEVVGNINPSILFIDEAHRLSLKAQEMLGIAMENWKHTFIVGKGRSRGPITTWVPKFTLICATTMEGTLSKPFRDRFKLTYIFKEYNFDESMKIVFMHAQKRNIKIDASSAARIAIRGRGTPRLIIKYLDAVHDAMSFLQRDSITVELAEAQFDLMKIDEVGLNEADIIILKSLYDSELPVGIDSLALRTNQDKETVSGVNEPYLIKLGFIERSKQGRIITETGIAHLAKHGYINKNSSSADIGRVLKSGA
jgi:holliday junction DNA helicase RuvB